MSMFCEQMKAAVYLGVLLTLGEMSAESLAQAVPAPPVVTVWQKLGIPQAYRRVRDGTTNRQGNFPGLERKPPLKRIGDPANLESPNDAISAAAKVKNEEDLAKQKIKALKYLATVGCGCYDKDGSVEKAFLAGLNDCTPDVRMAAIDAIVYMAENCNPESSLNYQPTLKDWVDDHTKCDEVHQKMQMMGVGEKVKELVEKERAKKGNPPTGGKCSSGCGACGGCCGHCCSFKIQQRLAEMAYGEKSGCFTEPVADIRAAALRAMCICPAPLCEEEDKPKTPEAKPPVKQSEESKAERGAEESAPANDGADGLKRPSPELLEPPAEQLPPAPPVTIGNPFQPPVSSPSGGGVQSSLLMPSSLRIVAGNALPQRFPQPRRAHEVVFAEDASVGDSGLQSAAFFDPAADGVAVLETGEVEGIIEVSLSAQRQLLVVLKDRVTIGVGTHVVLTSVQRSDVSKAAARVLEAEPGRILLQVETIERAQRLGSGAEITLRILPSATERSLTRGQRGSVDQPVYVEIEG